MTTRPSHQTPGQWPATGTIPWSTAPDATTIATYVPPAYVPPFAWSSEAPEYAAPPVPQRPRFRFSRTGIAAFVGGGLVAAAAAGLVSTLGATNTTPVDTTIRSAPAPTAAAAPAPAPRAPATSVVTRRTVTSSSRSSGSSAHRSPSSVPSPSEQTTKDGRWQPGQGSVSTPPNWNTDNDHWYTNWRDDGRWSRDDDRDDSRSSGDHDSSGRTTRDGDDFRSEGGRGHGGTPTHGQGIADHSNQNGQSK
jgi:hypothetical protein